jgi:heptosyltransferase-2
LVWNKREGKYKNLFSLLFSIRKKRYDLVINLQRFLSTGFLTIFSGAEKTVGFDKNPLSFFFSIKVAHKLGTKTDPVHEVERNLSLLEGLTGKPEKLIRPCVYPSASDFDKVKQTGDYICIAPTSVWFTKQLPAEKWVEFIGRVGEETTIFLLGGKADFQACEHIRLHSSHPKIQTLAGQLSFLQSAALMKGARMNFVNDSAPLHIASAINAPVTAIFCSTIPTFGFTPLSENAAIVETERVLPCRPCGLHGRKACPKGHFRCADIRVEQLLAKLG